MSHYSDVVIADGGSNLLGYWPLDEEWGTEDASPSANPAFPGIGIGTTGFGPELGGADGPGVLGATELDGAYDHIVTGLRNRIDLVTNPSAETNTTSWTPLSASMARDTTTGQVGSCSFKITSTAGATTTRLATTTGDSPVVTPGAVYTFRAMVIGKAANTIALEIVWRDGAAATLSTTSSGNQNYTGGGGWQSIEVTESAPEDAATARLFVYTLASGGSASDEGWVDAVMFEQNGEFDGYFDGATTRCNWTGTAHASTSAKGPFVNGQARTFEWFCYRDTAATTMAVIGSDVALLTDFMSIQLDTTGHVLFVPEVGGSSAQWDADWPLERWVHGMVVFDESVNAADLYVDGEPHEDNTKSVTDPWSSEPGYLQIGVKGATPAADPEDSNPFDGRIAHVAVYHGDQSALANSHAVLGLSELSARAAPAPWYSAA